MIVKQGDLFPDVETTVKDENGVVVDITGTSQITFSMRNSRNPSSVPINGAAGVLVNGPQGQIAFRWGAGQTDVAGTYEGEFKLTPAAGDAFRVPTSGYITVIIEPKVG